MGAVVVVVVGVLVVVGVSEGRVVVVVEDVVVAVLEIWENTGAAFAGDVAKEGAGVRDEGRLWDEWGAVATIAVVVVVVVVVVAIVVVALLAVEVGRVVVPVTCWEESVGVSEVSVSAKPHTAPLTARTAATSATPGYQIPSRT